MNQKISIALLLEILQEAYDKIKEETGGADATGLMGIAAFAPPLDEAGNSV